MSGLDAREPLLGVVIGRKGVGKSYTTDKMIAEYAMGNPSIGAIGRKVLILDVNDEYTHIRAISISDLIKFSCQAFPEIRRIRPFIILKNGTAIKMRLDDLAQTLNIILETFSNGLLLIEDINKYVSDSMPQDLMGAIATNRHRDLDIIMHYQGIGRIGPKVWQNLNWLRFHKITESVIRHRNKYEDKYELLRITELMVNYEYEMDNVRFFQYVDCENMRLIGKVDDEKFDQACRQFLEENYHQTINPLLRIRVGVKEKKFTAESAMQSEMDRLRKSYYKKAVAA